MKLAMAAFLILCTLVAIGRVSSESKYKLKNMPGIVNFTYIVPMRRDSQVPNKGVGGKSVST